MVTEWSQRVPADKLYANTVTLFNDKMADIELSEAASGNTTGQNGFSSANTVTAIMSGVVSVIKDFKEENHEENGQRDTILAIAVSKFKGGMGKLRSEMSELKASLATSPPAWQQSPTRRRGRSGRRLLRSRTANPTATKKPW